jgi:hypothetical protein
MDLSKVLDQLRRELDHLNAAILSLERLQTKVPRRGRPPRALAEIRKAHPAAKVSGHRQAFRSPTIE